MNSKSVSNESIDQIQQYTLRIIYPDAYPNAQPRDEFEEKFVQYNLNLIKKIDKIRSERKLYENFLTKNFVTGSEENLLTTRNINLFGLRKYVLKCLYENALQEIKFINEENAIPMDIDVFYTKNEDRDRRLSDIGKYCDDSVVLSKIAESESNLEIMTILYDEIAHDEHSKNIVDFKLNEMKQEYESLLNNAKLKNNM